jgi:hypothetical protein
VRGERAQNYLRQLCSRPPTSKRFEHDFEKATKVVSALPGLQQEARALVDALAPEGQITTTVTIAPPNSLVAIAEAPTDAVPMETEEGSGIGATDVCIVVGCLAEMDGETRITLGPPALVGGGDGPVFDGFLDTPHHKVAVWTIEWEKVLEATVPTGRTRVRIWTNHASEPDKVHVGTGE